MSCDTPADCLRADFLEWMKGSGASIAHGDAKDSHVLILWQGDTLERLILGIL
jgi:hypothetical protein